MNDRQRVEIAFFPLLFKSVLESAALRDEGFRRCVRALDAAIIAAFKDLDPRRGESILRRTARLLDQLIRPEKGVRADKVFLEFFYLADAILACGYLELEEGSPLAEAILAITEAMADAFAEARLDASAKKQARKILCALHEQGYFDGAQIAQ